MKMWAVIMPPKSILLYTAASTRRRSIEIFDNMGRHCSFQDMKKRFGYRCKRITVTVEGES